MKTKAVTDQLFDRFGKEGVPLEGRANQPMRPIDMIDDCYYNRRLQKLMVAIGCSVATDRCTLLVIYSITHKHGLLQTSHLLGEMDTTY
ncbi:Uncharacterized protein TCM_029086 [Theobroma cacao]|uniref:Uncharacterized protein n=1 Tax=Theobroma cacao TaxID=3641 RepID=A0A061GDH9_THECC|nr:Uncharacterized protein TCM_029086 [Theobroma cacao]